MREQVDATENNSNGSTEPNSALMKGDLPGCGLGGRGFESRRSPHTKSPEPKFEAAPRSTRERTLYSMSRRLATVRGWPPHTARRSAAAGPVRDSETVERCWKTSLTNRRH